MQAGRCFFLSLVLLAATVAWFQDSLWEPAASAALQTRLAPARFLQQLDIGGIELPAPAAAGVAARAAALKSTRAQYDGMMKEADATLAKAEAKAQARLDKLQGKVDAALEKAVPKPAKRQVDAAFGTASKAIHGAESLVPRPQPGAHAGHPPEEEVNEYTCLMPKSTWSVEKEVKCCLRYHKGCPTPPTPSVLPVGLPSPVAPLFAPPGHGPRAPPVLPVPLEGALGHAPLGLRHQPREGPHQPPAAAAGHLPGGRVAGETRPQPLAAGGHPGLDQAPAAEGPAAAESTSPPHREEEPQGAAPAEPGAPGEARSSAPRPREPAPAGRGLPAGLAVALAAGVAALLGLLGLFACHSKQSTALAVRPGAEAACCAAPVRTEEVNSDEDWAASESDGVADPAQALQYGISRDELRQLLADAERLEPGILPPASAPAPAAAAASEPAQPDPARRDEAEREVERILVARDARSVFGGGSAAEMRGEFRRLLRLLHPDKQLVGGPRANLALRVLVDFRRQLNA